MMLGPASPLGTLPSFQVLLITEAGRPLYHYVHPHSANHSQTSTLSAALAAFSATTATTVSAIRTPSLTLLTISKSPILLAIASQTLHPTHSIQYLKAIARQTLTALYTCLSASFIRHLANFPTYDPSSISATFEPLLNRIITSALTYPLPLALSLLPSLPAPIGSASHTLFSDTIAKALANFKYLSHILIFTASPLYPRRIIASVSRENVRLLDLLILLQIPPLHVNDKSVIPDLLFSPNCGFRKGFRAALRALSLQLDAGSLGANPKSICGINIQSLSGANDHAIWLMVLGEWKEGEDREQQVLNYIESSLDRSGVAKDVMVALRRPWKVPDIIGMERYSRHVTAVLILGNERFVETINPCDYRSTAVVLSILNLSSDSYISQVMNGMVVVMCERKYIVVFENDISEEDARYVMSRALVPWMKRLKPSLIPIDKGTIVHSSTPLAGFLAPFSS